MSAPMCLVPSSKIVELANKITQKYPEACQRDGFNAEKCAEWVGKYNSINGKNPDYLPSLSKLVNAVEQWRNKDGKSFLSVPVSVTYTHSGKQQTYSIIGDRIFNKKGEEVFSKDRRSSKKHRERIFSILKGDSTNKNNTSQSIDSDSITAQLIEHLRPMWQAMGLQIYDKAGIEAFLKNNPDAINRIQQAAERKEMADIKAKAIADGTFMKAPNGKPTNLTERQWLQVRTKAFKKWFGDWENDPTNASKVVDENGEPFVVYTGTTGNFTVFDSAFSKTASKGFFFTADKNVASSYGNVKEVFLNIKNLKEENAEFSSLDTENGKFDGISYIHNLAEAFVVWNPNQIKSATDNNGDFSTENDDIQMMVIGEKGAKSLDMAEEANTRMDNLSVANDMEKAGKDALTIKAATGWERGADGKWRYEVSDIELNQSWFEKISKMETDKRKGLEFSLSDILSENEAVEILKQYPRIASLKITVYNDTFFDLFDATRGYYNPKTNTLMLNFRPVLFGKAVTAEEIKSTLAHELQHLIQSEEGFAPGGNENLFNDRPEIKELEKQEDDLKKLEDEMFVAENAMHKVLIETDRTMFDKTPEYKKWREEQDNLENINRERNAKNQEIRRKRQELLDRQEKEYREYQKSEPNRIFRSHAHKEWVTRGAQLLLQQIEEQQTFDAENKEVPFVRRTSFKGEHYNYTKYTTEERERISKEVRELKRKWEKESKAYNDLRKQQDDLRKKINSTKHSLYKRIAGEAESRAVQRRLGLSAKERRESLFTDEMYKDIAKDDLIFLQDSLNEDASQPVSETPRENTEIFQQFSTPQGEVYGFVDKDGNMYLDETIIKPEHPIHEYTHMWDRVVAERNPELWKQGVSLMQQISLWDEIANSENYGKKWVSMGIKGDKLNDLIASEVHSRLTGREGERILNEIAAKKGNEGIIAKLRQWLTDFFRELKATFSNWTREEINNLTLDDFVNMTIRDLAYGTPFDTVEEVSEMPEEVFNDFAENESFYRQQEELRKQIDARPSSDSQLEAKFGNKNEVTVSEILDNLLSFNTPYEGFVKALKDNLGELGSLKIKLVNASHEMIGRDSAGVYDPSSNTIYINRNSAYKGKGGIVDGTILHEIVHAIVSNSLKTKERKAELEALFNEAREKILKKYGVDDYKDLPSYLKNRLYGLSNLNEFAAEFFTNSDFISELNDENTFGERNNKNSLFHRLIEWIKSLLPKGITDIYKNSAEVLEDIILNSGGQIQEDRILLDESRDNPLADIQNPKLSTPNTPLQIYSDGSDFKGTGNIGYGSVFEYNGKQYGISGTQDNDEVKRLKKLFPDAEFSNPTMEMLALATTLEYFANRGNGEHIVINQDYKGAVNYQGLWEYAEGSAQRDPKAWKAKAPYIASLVSRATAAIEKIKMDGGSVKINWVKGHQTSGTEQARMNDAADRYAKDRSNSNTMDDAYPKVQQSAGNPDDLSTYEFYSGAADGSDTIWAAIARRLGIKVTEYTRKDWDTFSVDEKAKLDREYRETAGVMNRDPIPYGKKGDVEVRRDMKQADMADAIFAVGSIKKPGEMGKRYENKSDHELVDGGTGYAVQRGIIRGIPVYVYDQTAKQWKMWDKNSNSFVPTSEPTLTPHAATIGTRDINDNGRMAIRNILSNSVNKLRRNQQQVQQPASQSINRKENTINQGNNSSNKKQTGSSNQKVSEQFKKDIDSLAGYFEGGGATIFDVLPNLSDELNSILSSHFMEFMGKKELTEEDYQKLWNAIEFYSDGEYRVPRERKPSPVSSPSPAVDVAPSTDILRRGAVDDDSEPAGSQGQSGPTANNNPQPQKPRAEKPKSPAFDSALNVKKDRKVEFYQTFTPQQIIDRGRLISDFFSDIIDENIQDIKDSLKKAAEDQRLSESKRTEAKKKLNEFRDPIKGRQLVAQHLGIPVIINKIREQIEMDRDSTSDENKKILYQNTLDYFEELFNTQASLDIEAREGIRIVGLKIDDSNTAEDEADEVDDGNDETGHTATGSDGWGFQVRYTNPFDSLSRAVRGMMYSIEKTGNGKNGTEVDDLGHTRYYSMGQIYATFLSYLAKHMENADDFMVIYKDRKSLTANKYVQGREYLRGYGGEVPQDIDQEKELFESYPEGFPVFPILEEMAKVYPWVSQIIDRLTNDFLNREDNIDSRFPSTYGSLASQFYTNFRKAYIPYGKIQLGGFGVTPLNYDMADRVMYDKLVANYNNRMVLTEWSIYDGNGKVNRKNAEKLKDKCTTNEFFQNLPHWFEHLDSLSEDEMNDYNSALGHAQKVIQSFGIDISQEGVVAYLAMGKFGDLMDKLGNIADIIEKLDDKDVESFDYIIDTKNKHGQNQWSHFFDGMGLITDDTYMQSFYDSASKKTKYSYSADNYLMKIFRGVQKGTLEERRAFIDSHFGKYEWFKNQKTGEWRNKWLEFWYNYDELESQEFTPYKNIDNITDNTGPKKVIRPYVKWKESDIYEIQHRSYDPEKHDRSTCYYLAPIFSDSPMSMTVRGPKFSMNELLYGYKVEKEGKEGDNVNPGAISHPESDKGKYKRGAFLELVHQEMQRISYVQRRAKAIEEGKVKPIVNFDTGRGEKFCFIPELNTYTFEDGSSFLQKVNDIKAQIERGEANLRDLDALEIQVIDEILTQKAMEYYGKSNLTDAEKQEFFNMTYANASIIQMTTIDLAYYKSDVDFQKRFKEVYAGGIRLNTSSRYGMKTENVILLMDDIITSPSYKTIASIVDGRDNISKKKKEEIKSIFKNINVADAQAIRSMYAFRSMLDMMGKWDERAEEALENFKNRKWTEEDFDVMYQIIKPFVYTVIDRNDGEGGVIPVPQQHKNSEICALMMYSLITNDLNNSPVYQALSEFMDETIGADGKPLIHMGQFESAGKVGNQGVINISVNPTKVVKALLSNTEDMTKEDAEIREILDKLHLNTAYIENENGSREYLPNTEEASLLNMFGKEKYKGKKVKGTLKSQLDDLLENDKISQEDYNKVIKYLRPNKDEIKDMLNKAAIITKPDGTKDINQEVVHTIPCENYYQAQYTPEHHIDAEAVFGSQGRNIVIADLPEDFELTVRGKNGSHTFKGRDAVIDFYYELLNENLIEDFFGKGNKKGLKDVFKDKESLKEAVEDVVRGNPKYGKDFIDALTIDKSTNTFTLSPNSPTMFNLMQEIVTSFFKNRITKQHVDGAALIQAAGIGLDSDLRLRYGKNNKLIGIECYMPLTSKKLFEPLLKYKTVNGERVGILDPQELRRLGLDKAVGYRIPTENKSSMAPLIIKGFTPQQNGSAIILPAEITALAGSDFDVDKMFIILASFDVYEYDRKQAMEDYAKSNAIFKFAIAGLLKGGNLSDEEWDEAEVDKETKRGFNEWFEENKDRYKYDKPRVKVARYDFSKSPKQNGRKARNNMILSMMHGILTSKAGSESLHDPQGFEDLKHAAKIKRIASDPVLRNQLFESLGGITRGVIPNANDIKEQFLELVRQKHPDLYTKMKTSVARLSDEEVTRMYIQVTAPGVEDEAVKTLLEVSLGELEDFIKNYSAPESPIYPQTFIHSHERNMAGSNQIGIYALQASMCAKYQRARVELKEEQQFMLNGNMISRVDLPDGGKRLKNEGQMVGGSADNGKDPNLSDMGSTSKTAPIIGYMLRAGLSHLEAALLIGQPIMSEAGFSTKKQDVWKGALGNVHTALDHPLEVNVTTEMLLNNILNPFSITEEERRAIAGVCYRILMQHEGQEYLTNVSRADSPNGSLANSYAKARIQRYKVDLMQAKMSQPNFPFKKIRETISNDAIDVTASEDVVREQLKGQRMAFLHGMYALGINSFSSLVAPYFFGAQEWFDDKVTKPILYNLRENMSDDEKADIVNRLYNAYIIYNLSGTALFGNETEASMKAKREYYLESFPDDFRKTLQENEEVRKLLGSILKVKTVGSRDRIVLEDVGSLDKPQKQAIENRFGSLVYSKDETVRDLAKHLFIYSYFDNGLQFKHDSFSHLFPTNFVVSFPKYTAALERLEEEPAQDELNNFIQQFLLTNPDAAYTIDGLVDPNKNVKDSGDRLVFDLNNYKNRKYLINEVMSPDPKLKGINVYPYVKYNGDIYILNKEQFDLDPSNAVYSRVEKYATYPKLPLYSKQMSVIEMSQEFPYTISTQKAQEEDMSTDIYDIPMEHGDEDVDPATQSMMDAMDDMNFDGFVDPSAAFDEVNNMEAEDKSSQYKKEGGEELQNKFC